jgi:hypothetical protein
MIMIINNERNQDYLSEHLGDKRRQLGVNEVSSELYGVIYMELG